jgi:hypothetical protein
MKRVSMSYNVTFSLIIDSQGKMIEIEILPENPLKNYAVHQVQL